VSKDRLDLDALELFILERETLHLCCPQPCQDLRLAREARRVVARLRSVERVLGSAWFIINYAEFRGWLERNAAVIRSCDALGERGRS
jgi:hypothetical protein